LRQSDCPLRDFDERSAVAIRAGFFDDFKGFVFDPDFHHFLDLRLIGWRGGIEAKHGCDGIPGPVRRAVILAPLSGGDGFLIAPMTY
jgi:hypothetical protein